MDKLSAYFSKTKSRETSSGVMIPESYDFWPKLLSYFLKKADNFRVDCWANEHEAIERIQRFGKNVPCEVDYIEVFCGTITQEFVNELIDNPFDSTGKIKWFSIFLMNDDRDVISCEHYGSEFATGLLQPEDVEFLKLCVPEDFNFDIFSVDNY